MGRIIDEDDVLAIINKHYVLGQGLLNSTLDAIEEKIMQLPSPQIDASDTDGDMISRKFMHDLGATCIARRDDDGKLIALGRIDMLPSAQPDSCEFYDTESHFCALHRPSVQPDRSLWFHIGETCVDESKGIISAEEAIKKIRELLRAADLILVEIASPDTFTEPKFHHEDWSEIL